MSVMKVWNGSEWVKPFFAYPKTWNGSDWVYGIPKYWPVTASTDSKAVTVGFLDNSAPIPFGGGTIPNEYYGYSATVNGIYTGNVGFGSIDNNVSKLYGVWDGAIITNLYYNLSGVTNTETVNLRITGASDANWTTMVINGNSYLRANASYNGNGGWTWDSTDLNPFGTNGTITVTWS